MGRPNMREQTIMCSRRPSTASPPAGSTHGVPFSSNTVRARFTPNRCRIMDWSASRRWAASVRPMARSLGALRRPTPHTSPTGVSRRIRSRSMGSRSSQTAAPPAVGVCLAQWLRALASVRVGAIVTVTGTPTPLRTAWRMSRSVRSASLRGGVRKHSSIEYAMRPGSHRSMTRIIRALRLAYNS